MGVLLVGASDADSIPKPELNWRRKADEVERPFRAPVSPKTRLIVHGRRAYRQAFPSGSHGFAAARSASIPYFQ